MRTHTHTHTPSHALRDMLTHTHTHTHMYTCMLILSHTNTHTYAWSCTHTHTHRVFWTHFVALEMAVSWTVSVSLRSSQHMVGLLCAGSQMTSLDKDVPRSEMLCMMAIPAAYTIHDLIKFTAPLKWVLFQHSRLRDRECIHLSVFVSWLWIIFIICAVQFFIVR